MRCPTCEKTFEPANPLALPFCSVRCQQIDLARWLNEGYSVPAIRKEEDEESEELPPEEAD